VDAKVVAIQILLHNVDTLNSCDANQKVNITGVCARLSAFIMQSRCLKQKKLKAAAHKVKLVLLKLNQVVFTLTQFIFAPTMEAKGILNTAPVI
jgi:hypothetical protein